MKLSIQPYKGTRDFYPEDKRLQNWIFAKWRTVCERFGYEEYDASVLEPVELYRSKTSDEIVNEQMFSFVDRGKREVALRPEMTPSVSRMVAARRQELGYPLRLYSIPNCFRYERMQRGRTREFWQLNADIFGVDGMAADIEVIQLADAVMREFGAKPETYDIQLNSRKLTQWLLQEELKVPASSTAKIMHLIDAQEKMSPESFKDALHEAVGEDEGIQLSGWINEGDLDSLPKGAPIAEVQQVISSLEQSGITNVRWHLGLARGFDYYTDIIFEVFDKNPENNRSMFGGGRYDGLVGQFGVEPVPTVGFGMGDATLMNFLESNGLLPELSAPTDVYVVVIGDNLDAAQELAQSLRSQSINTALDFSGSKPEKQLKNALKKGIPFAIFIGDEEVKASEFTLRDLRSKTESKLRIQEIAQAILDNKPR